MSIEGRGSTRRCPSVAARGGAAGQYAHPGRLSLTATAHPERLRQALTVLKLESLAARVSGAALLAKV